MISKNTTSMVIYIIFTFMLVFGFGFQDASATPILGQQVFYEGGAIEVTVLPYDASFTSNLYLFSTSTPLLVASNLEVGKVVNLGNLASRGVAIGDELVFGIVVTNTANTFFMGQPRAIPIMSRTPPLITPKARMAILRNLHSKIYFGEETQITMTQSFGSGVASAWKDSPKL